MQGLPTQCWPMYLPLPSAEWVLRLAHVAYIGYQIGQCGTDALCNSRVIVWRQAILEKCPLGHPVCECFVFRTERVQYAILHLEGPILPMPLPDCRTRVQAAAGVATGRCFTQSSSSPRLAAPYTT